jgi:hypothetical protein
MGAWPPRAVWARPDRGFEAIVIGEPQRAFAGAQFALTRRLGAPSSPWRFRVAQKTCRRGDLRLEATPPLIRLVALAA